MPLALLAVLIAVAQGGEPPPRYDLPSYLRIAKDYGFSDRTVAIGQIRAWPLPAIRMAVRDVRGRGDKLRAFSKGPDSIAIDTVEAAVLMHADAGLLALRASRMEEAEVHLGSAVALFSWSRRAARDLRTRMATLLATGSSASEQNAPGPRIPSAYDVQPRIDRALLSLALAAGALSAGQPVTAAPFAADARQAAPLDPEVWLVSGAVSEGLADLRSSPGSEPAARALREEAARAFNQALLLDAGVLPGAAAGAPPTPRGREALLHLGRIALELGWREEARKALEGVSKSGDERQRHCARLLLGRLAEQEGRPEEATASYRRALEVWPQGQSAALALAHATERTSGPSAARLLVAQALALSPRADSPADPWRSYLFGPPGLAASLFDRLRTRALGQ